MARIEETTSFHISPTIILVVLNGELCLRARTPSSPDINIPLTRPVARLLAEGLLRAADITKAVRKPRPATGG